MQAKNESTKAITKARRKARAQTLSRESIEARNIELQTTLQTLFDEIDVLYSKRDELQTKSKSESEKRTLFEIVREIENNRTSQKRTRKAIRTLHRKCDFIVHACERACCEHKIEK